MQLTSLFNILALSCVALAAPATHLMMAEDQSWTLVNFTRTCNHDDTICGLSYAIDTDAEGAAATPCAYNVTGRPASRTPYSSYACGNYSIGSSWSGQFAEGFTTLSVVRDGLIVYPSYRDSQLVNGTAVSPDQSYTPQSLP